MVGCNHCSICKLGQHHLPFWTGEHSNPTQVQQNLTSNCVKVPSMYLSNYSIRGTVLLASFFMAAGSAIRYSGFSQLLLSGEPWYIDFRLLPLPEQWFTVACHLCAIFAGGLAGSMKYTCTLDRHKSQNQIHLNWRIDACLPSSCGLISMVPTKGEGHCNSIWDGWSK